jgi:hypothetical protein
MASVPVTFPTSADEAASSGTEVYGLRTALLSGENYGSSTAADIFIHGRDYQCKMAESPEEKDAPDNGQFVRVYRLWADNIFDGSTWTGRQNWVSANRLYLFRASLLGYPYILATGESDTPYLYRHLPEPFRVGNGASNGIAEQWLDTRDGGDGVARFKFHASQIISIRGIAPEAQSPGTSVQWNSNTKSAQWTPSSPGSWAYPDEAYVEYEITVLFERLPYEVMLKTDADFLGEFSRFVIYQEDPIGRALQVRGGAQWITSSGYGQPSAFGPGNPGVDATAFAPQEGVPINIGENCLTWRWVDVPPGAVAWDVYADVSGTYNTVGLKAQFGTVNSTNFCSPSYSPYRLYTQESLLFRTAARSTNKPSVIGLPVNDYTLCFEHSPAPDGFGYWNRLLNPNGVFQRWGFGAGGSVVPYKLFNFNDIFLNYANWT